MHSDPHDVQRYLDEVDSPTNKAELIAAVERSGASQERLEALQALDREDFKDSSAVQAALE